MKRIWRTLNIAALTLAACNDAPESTIADEAIEAAPAAQAAAPGINPRLLRRFKPLREAAGPETGRTSEKVSLGRMLFFEARLSRNHDISCNSCHALDRYGVDGQPTSVGHRHQRGARNAPTVYGAAVAFVQFWDGRAQDVERQAIGPITNPLEMAAPDEEHVVRVLSSMPDYVTAFERAFPEDAAPVSLANVGDAIGAFEKGLLAPGRWDCFLEGDDKALTPTELEGLKVFTNVGCMVCHTGELLGGSMFERAGAVEPWPNQSDVGRFGVTKAAGDEMMFKVPTLRNVAETGPYFHDASAKTLPEAVTMMGRHQLGLELEPAEVDAIVAWLGALTGELPREYIKAPTLPASTEKTPHADPN